jgi:hypothetical protein
MGVMKYPFSKYVLLIFGEVWISARRKGRSSTKALRESETMIAVLCIPFLEFNLYCPDLILHLQRQASQSLALQCLCLYYTFGGGGMWVAYPSCHKCVTDIQKG